tara:strand:+ start:701 stop:1372 length:672 start_codon:yes stop_codon:yes gene_type:complete
MRIKLKVLTKAYTYVWFIPNNLPLLKISSEEENFCKSLNIEKSIQYRYSRGYIREVLSNLFHIDPIAVPLKAIPGKPPELLRNYGYLSISHCEDKLLIAWSAKRIGIDIERIDRSIEAKKICQRFYNEKDKLYLSNIGLEDFYFEVLKIWVIKESLIKWQRGQIAFDFKKWNIKNDLMKASHPNYSYELTIFLKIYKRWLISITSKDVLEENKNLLLIYDYKK